MYSSVKPVPVTWPDPTPGRAGGGWVPGPTVGPTWAAKYTAACICDYLPEAVWLRTSMATGQYGCQLLDFTYATIYVNQYGHGAVWTRVSVVARVTGLTNRVQKFCAHFTLDFPLVVVDNPVIK